MELLQSVPSDKKVFLCCGHWMWDQLTTLPKNVTRCISAGPLEFLKLIANAKSIISDSFHAMMFSIIFEKSMRIYLSSDKSRLAMVTRMTDFTERMAMEDCFSTSNKYLEPKECDYIHLEKSLSSWKNDSEKFLVEALN